MISSSKILRTLFPPAVLNQFRRFRAQRRAWISLWLLLGLYGLSLLAGLFANGSPWKIRFEGQTYFPWIQTLTRDTFYGDGAATEPDYRELARSAMFAGSNSNRISWTLIPYGPANTLSAGDIELPAEVQLIRLREQRVGSLQVNAELRVLRAQEAEFFFSSNVLEAVITELPASIAAAVKSRFANRATAATDVEDPSGRFRWSLSTFEPRRRAPRSVRILLRETIDESTARETLMLTKKGLPRDKAPAWYQSLSPEVRDTIRDKAIAAMEAPVPALTVLQEGQRYALRFERETVQFPFRPVQGHPLGLDESGRDVLVLLIYATQIALSFGFLLVACSVVLGTLIGGLQGYFGGWMDLICQRLIEVYESVPFLYVMILLGSIYGRSFGLLLFVYAAFNWVGISYYMRSEYLKGRAQPYTEAAKALGLSTGRIMWRHILPNSLVPLITLFPFLLVGAIGSLSALDYLGFGMPVGTPSWGDLLRQAQRYRYAWWLITYPSLALFTVILLGVFVGEGLRAAFDPKRATRWEA